jgi:hypothetical protein
MGDSEQSEAIERLHGRKANSDLLEMRMPNFQKSAVRTFIKQKDLK